MLLKKIVLHGPRHFGIGYFGFRVSRISNRDSSALQMAKCKPLQIRRKIHRILTDSGRFRRVKIRSVKTLTLFRNITRMQFRYFPYICISILLSRAAMGARSATLLIRFERHQRHWLVLVYTEVH